MLTSISLVNFSEVSFLKESESALLAGYVYTYKEFGSFSLISMYMHRHTAKNKDNKLDKVNIKTNIQRVTN